MIIYFFKPPEVISASIRMQEVIAAQLDSEATDKEQSARLAAIFGGEAGALPDDFQFAILPRAGMKSAAASKIGDIIARCEIDWVARLEQFSIFRADRAMSEPARESLLARYVDRMTQRVESDPTALCLFEAPSAVPAMMQFSDPADDALIDEIAALNRARAWALSDDEIAAIVDYYARVGRAPTEVELMTFAQVNSEHCRHKIFNAPWVDDNDSTSGGESLFSKIVATHQRNPFGVLLAFDDNAAVIRGASAMSDGRQLLLDEHGGYAFASVDSHIVIKGETHNHPTAISPFQGAATGSGGEIRDELATGSGAAARAGFCGFIVSAIDFDAPPTPSRIASPLEIMLDAPIGNARYNNEYGRANLAGFFRCYEYSDGARRLGYDKPVMLAGGIGAIAERNLAKKPLPSGALLVQLGGAGFRIGINGSAASSARADDDGRGEALDFDSVQRANPEMQRRGAQVIAACARRADNPILSIHDVGAGGVANSVLEIVNQAGRGAAIDLQKIPIDDETLNPLEVWCNESQERFIIALLPESLPTFEVICRRENCPYRIIGEVTEQPRIVVADTDRRWVDAPNELFFPADAPPPRRIGAPVIAGQQPQPRGESLAESIHRVLAHPTVACKLFLVTIGDRSVGGLSVRDQMVGAYQTPVADCAIVAAGFGGGNGVVYAIGERPNIAPLDSAASARIAVAEALTNLAAGVRAPLHAIALCANWMADCSSVENDTALHRAVSAIGGAEGFCAALGLSIIVGKDSLSMRAGDPKSARGVVSSPPTAVVTAVVATDDVDDHFLPLLSGRADTVLLLIAPSDERRLGGSVFAPDLTASPPDVTAGDFAAFWGLLQAIAPYFLQYHDRADGGLFATVAEIAFASNRGITLILDTLLPAGDVESGAASELAADSAIEAILFNEEIGCVVEVAREAIPAILRWQARFPGVLLQTVGRANARRRGRAVCAGGVHLS